EPRSRPDPQHRGERLSPSRAVRPGAGAARASPFAQVGDAPRGAIGVRALRRRAPTGPDEGERALRRSAAGCGDHAGCSLGQPRRAHGRACGGARRQADGARAVARRAAEVARRRDPLHQPQHATRPPCRRPRRRDAAGRQGRGLRRARADDRHGSRCIDDGRDGGDAAVNIVGYSDVWSVRPGERIRFMVSSRHPRYTASIVRLFHGDPKPAGPGLKFERVETSVDGEFDGSEQPYPLGSYGIVGPAPPIGDGRALAVSAWVYPTTPGAGPQPLVTARREDEAAGWGLYLEAEGDLALRIGGRTFRTAAPLRAFAWTFVRAELAGGTV